MSTDSTSPSQSPPTPSSATPPADSQPPPSTPAATPPPPAPTTSSPPPPTPTTSSPPPPSATPPPATTSPPPPASTATPSPPATPTVTPATPTVTPSPPTVTPSPPAPVTAAPLPKTGALPTPAANSPPQPKPNSQGTPSRPSPNTQQSASGDGSTPTSNDSPGVDAGVVAGAVVGGAVIIILLVVIICLMCCRRKKKPQYYTDPPRAPNGANQYYNQDQAQWQNSQGFMPPHPNSSGEFNSGYQSQNPMQRAVPPSTNMGGMSTFTYEELAAATDGFSQMNLLGQGGFGFVHKGILPDKREVAVKSLKSGSGQGEREFQAEVEIISRVHHRHLVSLVGYCIAGDQKLLVYEFVANGTMEHHLYGKDQKVLDWPTRLRIAIGSAKGLAYLHEDCQPRIIHRDIKAANILIDNNFEAMVADFGLAKLTTENHTHVSTRVMGTFGYLAPEYASSGKLSDKSDVFSFGVMLLELVTGRRPIDLTNMMEDSLVDWARPLLTEAMESGNYENLVDPRLEGNFIHSELARMAASAAASIRHSARKRPKMSQIVRALEGNSSLEDLNEGVKPGQSSQFNPSGGTEVYDTRAYNADMLKFKKMVMTTGEFESGESSDADSFQMEKR